MSVFDAEALIGDLTGHNGLGELPDHRELITKVGVDGLEPIGKLHHGVPLGVGRHGSVVEVLHLRRFHRGVIEVLVSGVERVVDLEVLRLCSNSSGYVDVAVKLPCIAVPRRPGPGRCIDSVAAVVVLGAAPRESAAGAAGVA